jgi:pimeloyl-ACP methyl ester carboxylesterase
LTPDFYGYGGTDAWPSKETLQHDNQADLAASVLSDAGLTEAAVDIVGHSYGGASAIRMVLRQLANVRSLVLIEPMLALLLAESGDQELFSEYEFLAHGFLDRIENGDKRAAWKFFIDYRNGSGTWDGFPNKTHQRFLDQSEATYRAFESNLANPTTLDDCQVLSMPVTVVCGEKTTAPDRRVTELLRDNLPNAHYVLIPDAEHMSPLTHPAEVADIIKLHLKHIENGDWS